MKFLFKFIFVLALSFALAEIGLRLLYSRTHSRTEIVWQDDSLVGRRLVPNQSGYYVASSGEYKTLVNVNNDGWRGPNYSVQKGENTYRILLIGDSFVEHFQAEWEQSLPKILERKIGEINGKKVEAIAMGLGDSGTAQQYLILKEHGLKYNPDMVIHFFFNGNDVRNNHPTLMGDPYRAYFELNNDGELVPIPFSLRTDNANGKLKSDLKNESRVMELLFKAKGKFDQLAVIQSVDDYPIDYHVYDTKYSNTYMNAWRLTEKLLLESKTLSEQNKAKYLLVSIASNEQVNDQVWQRLIATYPDLARVNRKKTDQQLFEICEKYSINCIFTHDALKKFNDETDGLVTHYEFDGHLTSDGANIITDLVKTVIISQ